VTAAGTGAVAVLAVGAVASLVVLVALGLGEELVTVRLLEAREEAEGLRLLLGPVAVLAVGGFRVLAVRVPGLGVGGALVGVLALRVGGGVVCLAARGRLPVRGGAFRSGPRRRIQGRWR